MQSSPGSVGSSSKDGMRAHTHGTMCCGDMSKRGDSFEGTGDMNGNSKTSILDTSYANTQVNDPSPSVTISRDIDYGLPQTAQRLRIDFTPNEGDTEFVQKKCCAFWEFIHGRKDLEWMMVSPTPDKYPFQDENRTETSSTPAVPSTASRKKTKSVPVEKTALSVLQLAEKRGIVGEALAAKMSGSTCDIGSFVSSDSTDNKPVPFATIKSRASIKASNLQVHAKKEKCRAKVAALCEELDNWDKLHPKSMDPPSHVPRLSRTVIQ